MVRVSDVVLEEVWVTVDPVGPDALEYDDEWE
eukprot:CAMPEP_0116966180 /NCGR_PEP_ID=MMETSP0467-20121206/49690_1 /TAXON_ID=283647 /ORGANISM="Mesodinium pulex, Strain SPMC105" /LENGTH=31 /DNA_ID= /DNA_START= /DNA_END= /DNA_ORIENTATION=